MFACTTSWCNCRDLAQRSKSYNQSDIDDNSSTSSSHKMNDLISCNAKPVVVAISIVSHVFIAYALFISSCALFQVKHQPADFRSISTPLSHVSIMVAVVDGFLLLVCFATDAVALLVAVSSSCPFDRTFIVLGFNGFYALLSILLHSPFIILAYVNDASLTGSISIFYVMTVSSQLLAVTRFYMVYQEYSLHKLRFCSKIRTRFCNKDPSDVNYDLRKPLSFSQPQSRTKRSQQQSQNGQHRNNLTQARLLEEEGPTPEIVPLLPKTTLTIIQKCDIFCNRLLFIICSFVFCVLIMGVAALLTCYLVILPITNGFSHLLDRLFITFHIAIMIVGALIYAAYKIFIEKKSDSHSKTKDKRSIKQKEEDNTRNRNRSRSRKRRTGTRQGKHDSESAV